MILEDDMNTEMRPSQETENIDVNETYKNKEGRSALHKYGLAYKNKTQPKKSN